MSLRPTDRGKKRDSGLNTNEGDNQPNTGVDYDAAHQQRLGKTSRPNVESNFFSPETGVLEGQGNISVAKDSPTSNIIRSCTSDTKLNDVYSVNSYGKLSQSMKCLAEEHRNLRKRPRTSNNDEMEVLIGTTSENNNVNVISNKTSDCLLNEKKCFKPRSSTNVTKSHEMSPQSLLVSCLKCLKAQIDQDFEQNVLKNFRILKDCGMRQLFDVTAIESFRRNIMEIYNSVESSHANEKLQIKEENECGGNPYVPKYKEMFYKLLKKIDFSKLTKEHSVIICDIYIHLISIAVLIGALVRAVDGESGAPTGCKSLYTMNVKNLLNQINIVSQRILRIIKAILNCLVKDNSEFFESEHFLTSMEMAGHQTQSELNDDSDCEIIEEFSTLPKPQSSGIHGHILDQPNRYISSEKTSAVVGDHKKGEEEPSPMGLHAIWINQEKMVRAVERQYSEDSSDNDYTVYSLWSQQIFNNHSYLLKKVPTSQSLENSVSTNNVIPIKDKGDKRHITNELMNVEDFYLDVDGLVTFKDLFRYNFDAKAWDNRADIIRNYNAFVVTTVDNSEPYLTNVRIKIENEISHLNITGNSELINSEFVMRTSENSEYPTPYSDDEIPSLHQMCLNVLQNTFFKHEDDWGCLSTTTFNTRQNVFDSYVSDQCRNNSLEYRRASSTSNADEESNTDNIKQTPQTLNSLCLDVCKSLLSMKKDQNYFQNVNRCRSVVEENNSIMSYKDDGIPFNPPTLLTLCTSIWQEFFIKANKIPFPLKRLCFITIKKIFSGANENNRSKTYLSDVDRSKMCDNIAQNLRDTKCPMSLAQQSLITINNNLYSNGEELDQHCFDYNSNHSDGHLSDNSELFSELFERGPSDDNLPLVKVEPLSDDDLGTIQVKPEHNYFTEENFNRFEDDFMRNYLEETTGQLVIPTIVDTNVLSATDFNNLGCEEISLQNELLQIKKEIVESESVEPQYLCRPIVVKKEGVKREYEPDSDSDNEPESLWVEIPNKYRDDSEMPVEGKKKRGRPKKVSKKNTLPPVPLAPPVTTAASVSFQQAPTGRRFNTRSNKQALESTLTDRTASSEDLPTEANTDITQPAQAAADETIATETVPAKPILGLIEPDKPFENSKILREPDSSTHKADDNLGGNFSSSSSKRDPIEEKSSFLGLGITTRSKKHKKITASETLPVEATAAVTTPVEVTADTKAESISSKPLVIEIEPLKPSEPTEIPENIDRPDDNVDSANIWRYDSDMSTHEADDHQGGNFSSSSSDMDSSEEILHLLDLSKTKKGKKRRRNEKSHELPAEENLSNSNVKEVEMDIKSVVEEKTEIVSEKVQPSNIKLEDEIGAFVLKDGWKVYDIQDGDTKLFELCTVPLDKLPETFAANYLMDFQQHHEEKEINSLIDFSNLTRRAKESDVGKEEEVKSRLKKTAVKKTDMVMNKNGKYEYHKVYSESESDTEACEAKKPKNLKEGKQPEVSQENEAARNCLVNSSDDEDGSRVPKVEPETESQEISSPPKQKSVKKEEKNTPTFEASSTSPRIQRLSAKKSGLSNGSESLLTEKLSGTDSEEEERRWQQKKKMLTVMQRKRLQKLAEKVPKSDEDDDGKKLSTEEYKIQRTRNKKRRRDILMKMEKEFMYSGGFLISKGQKLRGRSSKSKPARGRKNIRQILDKNALAASTKQATKEEEDRRQRLNQKNAKLKEVFKIEGSVNVMKIDGQLCLDYDIEEGKPLVSVDSRLTEPMKHHQCEGVKFMWDACFESLARVQSGGPGGGCILAHCMGLGKTLQVIALVHTIMKIPDMRVKHVLVCCPLSTALNWVDEFHKWLGGWDNSIKVFEMSKLKKNYERCYQLEDWYKEGGVFVIGYEMFRMLTTLDPQEDDVKLSYWTKIKQTLLEPGPDVVVCDEGHLLKNDHSSLAAAMSRITTKRRITLTGTPMQNNLKEYYCMVNFVRPNLLGTYREFVNRFESPIMNGQHRDSSESDIKIMKWRSHILHNMLEGCLQRMEASVLDPYLPKKHEYVLLVTLSTCQAKMYKHFLDNFVSKCKEEKTARRSLLRDFYVLQKIWTHPRVLHLFEASCKDIGQNSAIKTEADMAISAMEEEMSGPLASEAASYKAPSDALWWLQYLDGGALLESHEVSHKFTMVFNILDECDKLGDKTLLFSTSLFTLDALEYFLQKVRGWHVGADYYRLDGSVPADIRQKWCRDFNTEGNKAKLFLMSTRVGSLGINMVGANRVIIFDTSWNPAHDIQSIFRVYRFGQQKECFIYRLVAMGTMEERIYERSVFKTAVSCRVVDEHQIDRHYNMADLSELYKFTDSSVLSSPEPFPSRVPPRDALVATLLLRCSRQLRRCHEHDSLLRNMCDEQLDEAERRQAWDQYNTEHLSKEREAEIQAESRKTAEELRKQKSEECSATGSSSARPGAPVPLHPALYDNPYFVTIVATALRTARPEMTDESALKTAKLNLNLLKKHHLPDVYSVIHSIAMRTLGEITLRNLWTAGNKMPCGENSSKTSSLPQIASGPRQSLLKINQKSTEEVPSSSSTTPPPKTTTITRKKLSKSVVTKTSTEPVVPNITITERPVPVEGSLVAVPQPGPATPTPLQYVYNLPSSNVLSSKTRLLEIKPGQMSMAVPAKLVKQKDGKTVLVPSRDMIPVPTHLLPLPVARPSESIAPDQMPTIASAPTPVGMIRNQHSFISMDVPDIEESILPDDMPRFQNASPPPNVPMDHSKSPERDEETLSEDILLNYIRKQKQNQEAESKTEAKKPTAKLEEQKPRTKLEEIQTQPKRPQTRMQQKKTVESKPTPTTEKKGKKPDVDKHSNKKNIKEIKKIPTPIIDDDDVYIIPDDDDDDIVPKVAIPNFTQKKSKNSLPNTPDTGASSSKSVPDSSETSALKIISRQNGTSLDKSELTSQTKPVVKSKVDKFTSSREKLEMLLGNTKIIRKKVDDASSSSSKHIPDYPSNESTPRKAESPDAGETSQVTFTRLSDRKSMSANQLRREVPTVTDAASPVRPLPEVGVTIFKQNTPLSLQNNSSKDPLAMDADVVIVEGLKQKNKMDILSESLTKPGLKVSTVRVNKQTKTHTEEQSSPVTSDDDLIVISPKQSENPSNLKKTSTVTTNGNPKKPQTRNLIIKSSTPSKTTTAASKTLPSIDIDDDVIDITPDDPAPPASSIIYSSYSSNKIPPKNLVSVKPNQKSLVRIIPATKSSTSAGKSSTVPNKTAVMKSVTPVTKNATAAKTIRILPKTSVTKSVTPTAQNVASTGKTLKIISNTAIPKNILEAAKNTRNSVKGTLPNILNSVASKKGTIVTKTTPNNDGKSSVRQASALIRTAFSTQKNESSSVVIDLDSYVPNAANKKQNLPSAPKAMTSTQKPSGAGKPPNAGAKPPPGKLAIKRPGPLSKAGTSLPMPKRKCLDIIELD